MEFFLFASLMAIDMLLFIFLATRYTYVESLDGVDETDEASELAKSEDAFADGKAPVAADKPVETFAVDNKGYSDSAIWKT